ncbi:MAG: four helix bundle protein [Saprospiraceae bacterium]|nr:four helix bundle protein [Saprospiraceae bacterium]
MKRHNFKQLNIWMRAKELVLDIYRVSRAFPSEEMFGLTRQIRTSAVSIPSNIAEGCGRGSSKQLVQYCNVAQGSAFELETQLMIARDLEFLLENESSELLTEIAEIQKMIDGFIRRFK